MSRASRTTTTASTQPAIPVFSIPLLGSRTPPPLSHDSTPSSSSLDSRPSYTPLKPKGALIKWKRKQLSPKIGVKFGKELQLHDVLRLPTEEKEPILHDLAYEISLHGVCFFRDQASLTPSDLAELALALGTHAGKPHDSTLHIHPTQSDELGENGLPVGKIDSEPGKDGRQISFADERSNFASAGWHTDISFEQKPANFSLLKMHTLPEAGGDTLFSSSYAHYDALSPFLAQFLETLTATHSGETFVHQARRHGFSLRTEPRGSPDNVGDEFVAIHPVIRTNLVTGLKGLFVNETFTTRINEMTLDESNFLLRYLFTLQKSNHDAQVRYTWKTNDLAIWNNASTNHCATWDFGKEKRAGDRVVCVGERPFLDKEGSWGRTEWEARQSSAF